MIRHKSLLALVVVALASNALAQSDLNPKVDEYVRAEMNKEHIPGLALGVYRDGNIEHVQGYGLANVELNVPVKPETIFQSGSVGKQFTAAGVMMLVEEGKIGLDDPVTKYFPDAPASWRDIKIKNLLSHTSGLSEYESDDKTKPGGPINLRADYTEDSLVKIIESFPMDFQPGEKWAYRNTNYVLLGVIIHKVTGQFYGDFLQERIFKPLAMTSTRVISEADIIPNRSAGYQLIKGELKNQDWVSPFFNTTADGALYFNVLDLAKWDAALYTEKLLKQSSLDRMWTIFPLKNGKPNSANYGFAWFINDVNGHRLIEHSGAWQGFATHIARYVDDRLTVVVLTNLDAGHADPEKIAHGVAGIYNPALIPPPRKPIADTEPQVTGFLRAVLEKIAAGRPDESDFTPEARSEWFPDRVKKAQEHMKTMGPVTAVELLERKENGDEREYLYRVKFEKAAGEVRLRLNAAGKILELQPQQEE